MAVDKQIEKQGSAPINTHGESLEPMGPVIGEGVEEAEGRGGEGASWRGANMWRQTWGRVSTTGLRQKNPNIFQNVDKTQLRNDSV